MSPFDNIAERELAQQCSADTAEVMRKAFEQCETQKGAVVVGVAGVAGAVASLTGAFYAAYPDELTPEIVDIFWRDLIRDIVLQAVGSTSGPCSDARAELSRKPVQ